MTLSLRLAGDIITHQASNLQTKNISPGGFASVSFSVKRELDQSLFEQFTDCFVYDSATGEQVGGGRLMEQGRNDDGTWQVTCLGEGLASMQDRKAPYFLVDGSLDNWVGSTRTTPRFSAENSGIYPGAPNDIQSLLFQTREDKDAVAGASLLMTNKIGTLTDQNLGGFGYRHKEGFGPNSNWRVRSKVYTVGMGTADTLGDDQWDGGAMSARSVYRVGTHWTNPRPIAAIQWARINTDITATESQWAAVNDPIIRAQIHDQNGALLTSGYSAEYVLIHQAFIDVVASFCPRLDLANATIHKTSTQQFDQLAWLDGITPMGVMEDLLAVESAFTWHVWEQNPNGLWETELVALPTSVRYEASVDDGFSAPSPTTEVYNRVTVVGKSPGGRDVNVTRTSTVPALDDAGIVREETISFGSEVWSTTNANKAGDDFLAEHAVAPNAGTLTIARPIYDHDTGRWVKPWNIRSGGLIRVRGIQPTPDTLNATSPDGVTVFRIVSVTYNGDSGQATLELDSYQLTESRAIAALARSRSRRGSA